MRFSSRQPGMRFGGPPQANARPQAKAPGPRANARTPCALARTHRAQICRKVAAPGLGCTGGPAFCGLGPGARPLSLAPAGYAIRRAAAGQRPPASKGLGPAGPRPLNQTLKVSQTFKVLGCVTRPLSLAPQPDASSGVARRMAATNAR